MPLLPRESNVSSTRGTGRRPGSKSLVSCHVLVQNVIRMLGQNGVDPTGLRRNRCAPLWQVNAKWEKRTRPKILLRSRKYVGKLTERIAKFRDGCR